MQLRIFEDVASENEKMIIKFNDSNFIPNVGDELYTNKSLDGWIVKKRYILFDDNGNVDSIDLDCEFVPMEDM